MHRCLLGREPTAGICRRHVVGCEAGGRVVRLVMQRILVFSACHRIVVDVWHTVVFRHVYRVVVNWIVDVG